MLLTPAIDSEAPGHLKITFPILCFPKLFHRYDCIRSRFINSTTFVSLNLKSIQVISVKLGDIHEIYTELFVGTLTATFDVFS